jgi:hypothetical protein
MSRSTSNRSRLVESQRRQAPHPAIPLDIVHAVGSIRLVVYKTRLGFTRVPTRLNGISRISIQICHDALGAYTNIKQKHFSHSELFCLIFHVRNAITRQQSKYFYLARRIAQNVVS